MYTMPWPAVSRELLYITLPSPSMAGVPNDALRREDLDNGCTYRYYVRDKYPNHSIISLLIQPGEVARMYSTEKFELPHGE